MTKKWKLTHWIMLGMILGIVVGYACHQYAADEAPAKAIAADFGVVTTIFLHMVKMIIAPLVFATLVSGIASMDSGKSIGRIDAKVLGWFIVASLVSLSIGLLFVNIAKPGANLNMPLPPANASTHLQASALSVKEFYRCIGGRTCLEGATSGSPLSSSDFRRMPRLARVPASRLVCSQCACDQCCHLCTCKV